MDWPKRKSLISTDIEYIIKIYIKFLMYTFSFHNGSNKNWLCTSFGHVPGPLKNEGDGNQTLGDDSIWRNFLEIYAHALFFQTDVVKGVTDSQFHGFAAAAPKFKIHGNNST